MVSLGTKLVQMDAVPAVLHYEEGGMDGPLELRHVQVDGDTVHAVVHVQSGGTQSLARITGGLAEDTLELQIPTEPAEFDTIEEFLAADDIFEPVRTIVDIRTGV